MFCEVVVCFFGVTANVFRASLQNKIRFASVSEASDAENIGIYSVLCSFSFKNHVPMVPRSQKKMSKNDSGPPSWALAFVRWDLALWLFVEMVLGTVLPDTWDAGDVDCLENPL